MAKQPTTAEALQAQCHEHWERCFFTSNALIIWLRRLRLYRGVFVVLPVVLGAIPTWDYFTTAVAWPGAASFCALLAGLLPAVYAALKLDESIPITTKLAGEYKNLEITFAELKRVGPTRPLPQFEEDFKTAKARLEAANAFAYSAPEWCFKEVQAKQKKGDYTFE